MATKTKKTARDRLHQLVDEMDDTHAMAWLTILQGQPAEPAVSSGKGPTAADDPLWKISGMVGVEYAGPTDVSVNKYRYIAEHPEVETD